MNKLVKENGITKLLTTTELPKYEDGKVTIMVVYVGLCRTDLYVSNNTIQNDNLVLGHEFSGIVVYDPTNTYQLMDSVTVNPMQNNKFMGVDFDGCLQTYINVEPKYIHKHNLPSIYAAYTEPFSASLSVINYIKHNDIIGIYGNNRIATLTYSILKELKYNVSYVDLNSNLLFDTIIETEISSNNTSLLISKIKEYGQLIIKSRNIDPVSFNLVECVKKSIKLQFSNYYDFNKTLQYMEQLSYIITPLLGKIYPITEWKTAFKDASENSSKKVFIQL